MNNTHRIILLYWFYFAF